MKIYKYFVPPEGSPVTYRGAFHRILTAQVQNNDIMVWAELLDGIDEDHPVVETELNFIAIGTGWQIPDDFLIYWNYIGTVQKDGFVWHIYYSQNNSEELRSGDQETGNTEEEDAIMGETNAEYKSTEKA